jgi:type IV fimbrial biogenesis protein FimT
MNRFSRNTSAAAGFTLIELLVTVAVTAVLLGLAVPSFLDLSVRNRLSGYANDLIASVHLARSEAVRRGSPISICKSDDGASCAGSWSDGWIVFVDRNSDSVVDDGEDILKVFGALTDNYTLSGDFATGVTYGADGAANSTGLMALCHDGETVGARAIQLTRLRPRIATDTDGDRIPNRDDSENIASCDNPSA